MTIGASLSFFLIVPLLASALAAVVPSLIVRRLLNLAVPLSYIAAIGHHPRMPPLHHRRALPTPVTHDRKRFPPPT